MGGKGMAATKHGMCFVAAVFPGRAGVSCDAGLPRGSLPEGLGLGCGCRGRRLALVFELIDGAVGGGDVGAWAEIDGLIDAPALS